MKPARAFLLLALSANAWSQNAIPEKPNPLALADGRITFGIEDQTRFEYRENNFDFNSALGTVNDDAWLLNRFRLNLKLQPTPWLTFFAEGQDLSHRSPDELLPAAVVAGQERYLVVGAIAGG